MERRQFAYRVASLDDLDPIVCTGLREHIQSGEHIQQIILVPRQRSPGARSGIGSRLNFLVRWGMSPDYVLVSTQERLIIATIHKPSEKPVITSLCLADILSVELGAVLLFAWVEWIWINQGVVDRLRIYYNSARQYLFQELLTDICRVRIAQAGLSTLPAGRNLELLMDLPYKFKNIIANVLLLPDEQLRCLVFRPATWSKRLKYFRIMEAPNLALILTNYHLLVMREDFGEAGSRYGVIFQVYPLDSIGQATVERQQDAIWFNLTLQKGDIQEVVRLSFPSETEDHLRNLALSV